MKASDYIIQFLVKNNVHHVFQMIGGAIAHLVDSTIDCPDIACITMHHEQAAAFAAEGYARCNGKLGVAMATSGPGATNLITGIGSCFFDSVPALFITGQVNSYEYKFDRPIRQVGFQETDIVSIIKPITKGARMVLDVNDIPEALAWAVHLAQSGRPGPVLLDIPMNIQRAELACEKFHKNKENKENKENKNNTNLNNIIKHLQNAKRPVVLVGGGVRVANATEELFKLIEITNIPIVASLMGLDAFPHTHDAFVGMIGAYGNRYANLTVANADFLLVLGSRLDTRQTGTRPDTFARGAVIARVDVDCAELDSAVKADIVVQADVNDFLNALNNSIQAQQNPIEKKHDQLIWQEKINSYKKMLPSFPLAIENYAEPDSIDANEFMHQLSGCVDDDAIIVLDVGQHQMWAAQSFKLKPKQRMIISGGMGAMGFALPAAIGAIFAYPKKQVIVITGDGGLQVNSQEFQTIVRNRLSIKIVLMNNQSLGMVRQFQQVYFNSRMEGTVAGYDCPDFVKLAEAYGISAACVTQKTESIQAIQGLLENKTAPALLDIRVPQLSRVEPKLRVNHPIEDQDPLLSREVLASLMIVPPIDVPSS